MSGPMTSAPWWRSKSRSYFPPGGRYSLKLRGFPPGGTVLEDDPRYVIRTTRADLGSCSGRAGTSPWFGTGDVGRPVVDSRDAKLPGLDDECQGRVHTRALEEALHMGPDSVDRDEQTL